MNDGNAANESRKVQVWVSKEMKAGMQNASETHFINWSRFIRREIQIKLDELKRQHAKAQE